jgi:two-component system cell cycle response regulator
MSARILVVDDILPNVKLLEAKLSAEYYDVLTATNGPDALKKVASESPDLVLLDVMMPGMDGFEVCTKIKQDPALAHIPVVMVTALTDPQDKVRGLESGADDFLSKPINDMALMARVRSLIRLKMALDEWRARERTASQLGVVDVSENPMRQAADKAKILIVEDKDFEVRKIQDSLRTDSDDVIVCENGIKAMEALATHEFDVLVISLNLAGEDGLRFCSHLKSNERTRAVPIIMIGTEEDMPRIAQGLEIGAHDYILRPIDRNELLARVRTQVRRKRFQERLRTNYEISLSMALTDALTGLYNRRYLEVHLQKLLQRSAENRKYMAVLLLDIDHFKKVNDTYGHKVGDEVLKVFADRIKDKLRSFDLVARLGGEEFVVILPDVSEKRAHLVAERLRTSIAEEPFKCSAPSGQISVTTSVGGAFIEPGTYEMIDILARADKCLYEAKESGRNATVFEGIGKLNPDDFKEAERILKAEL